MLQFDRRLALKAAAVLAAAGSAASAAAATCAVQTTETQAAMTPEAALRRLQEGNQRFATGQLIHCDLLEQVKHTATGQAPFAAVLGCIDSRVPPELMFDQNIGDMFVARIAGNFVDDDILGSLEFATRLSGAKLIVVLGHSECGAIKGAIDGAKLGHLTGLLAKIRPAFTALRYQGVASSKNVELVQRVAERNVQDSVARLARAPVLAALVKTGQLKIVGAMHDVHTGRVSWMG